MPPFGSQTPRIIELAARIEDDIRRRNLQPGEPYLTAAATARMLGVGNAAANRALQVLAKRNVLHRRQRIGTVIADGAHRRDDAPLARVHLMVEEGYLKSEGLLADGVVVGLQDALPGANVQFSFFESHDMDRRTAEFVREAHRGDQATGVILVRAPLAVQRAIRESGLPAVIHGTPYPSVTDVPCLDRDHRQVGELLIQHLLGHGCRRIGLLLRERTLPGDFRLLDGVRDTLEAAGVSAGSISIRPLPADREVIRQAVADLLAESDEPLGLMCRSQPLAEGAQAALEKTTSNGARGDDCRIVVADAYRRVTGRSSWPHAVPRISPQQIGARLGRMLAQRAAGQMPEDVTLEVNLHTP